MIGHHVGMLGGTSAFTSPGSTPRDTGFLGASQGGMGQQGMNLDSSSPCGENRGEAGHAHEASNAIGTTGNPQFHQGHGGPPYCLRENAHKST